jgi:hypothetical protein
MSAFWDHALCEQQVPVPDEPPRLNVPHFHALRRDFHDGIIQERLVPLREKALEFLQDLAGNGRGHRPRVLPPVTDRHQPRIPFGDVGGVIFRHPEVERDERVRFGE